MNGRSWEAGTPRGVTNCGSESAAVRVSAQRQHHFLLQRGAIADVGIASLSNGIDESRS